MAAAAGLPLLVWWLGWYPGFISSDSVDQLTQVAERSFNDFHPAFHTISMWLVTRAWDSPGAVALVQVLLLTVLLALVVKRLIQLGVPLVAAVGAAWLVGLLPAVGPTILSIWKDIPFALALLWVFAELLLLARLGASFWQHWPNVVRLGVALALAWLYRHNGLVTVVPLLGALAIGFLAQWRRVLTAAAVCVGLVLLVQGPVFALFSVARTRPATAELLIPDVASSLIHEPSNFSLSEIEYLETIAPLDVWESLYDCDDSDGLLFDPAFGKLVIRENPDPFLTLGIRTVLRDLDTTLGHRWCMASYLVVPGQPSTAFFHRPPFNVWTNDLGLERDPISDRAFDVTLDIYQWAEPAERLWLTWRPAIPLWLAVATYAALAYRGGRLRRLLWPGSLMLIHLANVAATSLTQEFRFAFPLYLMAWMSLPLAWLALRPDTASSPASQSSIATDVSNGRPVEQQGHVSDLVVELQAGGSEEAP